MKKLIVLISFVLFAVVAMAQERTVNVDMGQGTYFLYTGTASDVLIPTTTDTIDVVFRYSGPGYIKKVALKSRFDMRSTADTTVAVSVFGKEFVDDTYAQVIASTVSNVVTSNNVVQVLKSAYVETMTADTTGLGGTGVYFPVKTTTVSPVDKSYRYYRVRYILQGNDSVGTGIKLDEIELKLYID